MKLLLCLLLGMPLLGWGQARPDDYIYTEHIGAQDREIRNRCLFRGEYNLETSVVPGLPPRSYCHVVGNDLTPLLAYLVGKGKRYRVLVNEGEHGTFAVRYQQAGTRQLLYLPRRPFKAFLRTAIRLGQHSHSAGTREAVESFKEMLEQLTPPTKKERKMFSS